MRILIPTFDIDHGKHRFSRNITAQVLLHQQEQMVIELQRETLAEDIGEIISDVMFHSNALLLAGDVWGDGAAAAAADRGGRRAPPRGAGRALHPALPRCRQ